MTVVGDIAALARYMQKKAMRLNLLIATNSFLILIKAMRCIELLF
jgi:hypothetical protein